LFVAGQQFIIPDYSSAAGPPPGAADRRFLLPKRHLRVSLSADGPQGEAHEGEIIVQSIYWTTAILLAAGEGGGSFGGLQLLTIWLPIGLLFYWLLIRPQQREKRQRQAMLGALKKNDRVITAGGIYGVVTNVHREADEVTIKVDEASNTKLRMTLGSIARVLVDE